MHAHDLLVTPDGVWAQPDTASLGKALSLLSAARVAVNHAMSRDATGASATPFRPGAQDLGQLSHALSDTRGSAITLSTTSLNQAATVMVTRKTLHGDAPPSVGMLLLPRNATTCMADLGNTMTVFHGRYSLSNKFARKV